MKKVRKKVKKKDIFDEIAEELDKIKEKLKELGERLKRLKFEPFKEEEDENCPICKEKDYTVEEED